jgi:molybdate transport system substrate-binding protein
MDQKDGLIQVYCAGSLREVLQEIAGRFKAEYGPEVRLTPGPSGTLRERIESGDRPDIFASANMEHPAKLLELGIAGPTALFAQNRLCVISRMRDGVTQENLLEKLLDPGMRLGTSTPVADPGGDYAWLMFGKAEEIRPGSFELLAGKARQLIRGPVSLPVRPGTYSIANAFKNDEVDFHIAYRTTAKTLLPLVPELTMTELPLALAVKAYFGLTMIRGACAEAGHFILYLLSPAGQKILADFGFIPVYEML